MKGRACGSLNPHKETSKMTTSDNYDWVEDMLFCGIETDDDLLATWHFWQPDNQAAILANNPDPNPEDLEGAYHDPTIRKVCQMRSQDEMLAWWHEYKAKNTISFQMRSAARRERRWPTGHVQIDSGDGDDHRLEWTADYEQAWYYLSDEERRLLAGWRARLFRPARQPTEPISDTEALDSKRWSTKVPPTS